MMVRPGALARFVNQTVPYETWRAPLDARLSQLTLYSALSMGAALLVLILLQHIYALTLHLRAFFLLGLGEPIYFALARMLEWRNALLLINLASIILFFALYAATRVREGRAHYHWLAFAEAVMGLVNFSVFAVIAALVALNLIAWLFLVTAILLILFRVVFGKFPSG
jgi:hypothetical protein